MSFFDEGDEPTRVTRSSRPRRGGGGGSGGGSAPRTAPRRPDRQTLLVRQGVAIGVGLLLIIVIAVGVRGCVSNQQENALKDYNRDVNSVTTSSDRDVGRAFFQLLSSGSDQAQDLQVQVNQLRLAADEDARRARSFDVPDERRGAHNNLLLTLDFGAEALRRIAAELRTYIGRGQPSEQAVERIAGQMQKFLASDVVYNQRVAPLIKESLDSEGITGQRIPTSQFMPSIAWLSPDYVAEQLGAEAGTQSDEPAPALHGHGLTSVAEGDNTRAGDRAGHVPHHVRQPGRQRRAQRAGHGHRPRQRSHDHRAQDRPADEGRLPRRGRRAAQPDAAHRNGHGRRRDQRRPGRAEDRQQPPALHDHLHALTHRSSAYPSSPWTS